MTTALAAYRHLLRAAGVAFRGDERVLTAARQQIAGQFRQNASLPSDEREKAVKKAEEVASFLKQNVVQGRRTDDGSYKLQIHEETERGDNDTIRLGNKNIKIDGKTCKDT
ncbi:Mitochondrial zinc maintenance protein 1, mitochondrial [Pyricularia oryzae]|uniref:Mitochondrial zinc maintenance protein 1, mitochondrial n=1 Tax=Pyricularia oryzae TaxID=318829 RepID=A0A4P7NVF5_PYROR|nr:Mitochondrial zinc maintenance protein 1, mitochondrial [Pyricularia oryzae]KAH9437388.1 Mitochondrial zinc maintenance protein 1, mitochondrial [Pyricularia oryzae]KAI6254666.1 Mitochondrial zinc maintenance protein 1, mitochondrial [Pyricularia oryzae]KAI6284812.1 Mitochondrial zinc maintenance protein 1, mitochondrial [Pyricularia oryzae]KAI6306007.1 Mitochondrial zinc maintenance protein 1, mitochondrial [Pyricularia oryzae]